MTNPILYYCSDDYGMTPLTCDRIDECRRNGHLNKISVLPNTEVDNITERLQWAQENGIMLSVHLTLVEGKCVANPAQIPLLVDENGYFKYSFGGLLKLSLTHPKAFGAQIRTEISAQLHRAMELFPDAEEIAIDSHQHTYMIPAIFRAVADVITTERLRVSYMRLAAEPILPFLTTPAIWKDCLSVNLIKHWLLKAFSIVNLPVYRRLNIPSAMFFGIMFSGNMNTRRVEIMLPKYIRLAQKRGQNIEVLFHPGYTEPGEPVFDKRKESFRKFYFSAGRKNEYTALTTANLPDLNMIQK